ncbi:MAG: hypothetical protein IPL71_22365 [Anaerolineales bacterium]|uniref:hypothetical protein n=1 Tax=Candidatus Villigracilis proximus TaxID=3140683 RepID=UPI00313769B4|nr:hypothetical protein [Anaerolineales bacterium]
MRARYMRMRDITSSSSMGSDTFGLARWQKMQAIKDGIHPMKRTFQNIERIKQSDAFDGRMSGLGT